ncbi:hypothetical protein P3X46_010119 [Hevea brasiliensis]|uniref:Malectin-like domain-containing protein n=1 Tax=Hevea brasiliensis TaxID=3981 RepID=A0ABQ9MD32_HEVBR|nr:probable LRR receptor-like serine/threonine-protein kinase At5g16900 [Hevea brasiliensis]KAJ9178219.1 hypothetical protein P3X46_010119 [Hevea brasiliensis]
MASHLPLLLLLLLSAMSTLCSAWNVSIDCGSSVPYVDFRSVQWTGDDSFFMPNGKSQEFQVEHSYRELRSLRAFFSEKRSCYSINATEDEKVLVRATFYYGNYDNISQPPTFELQLDGNFWAAVETEIDKEVRHEAIYYVKGDAISVCVAQMKTGQFPFMSALEVRSLATEMYAARADKNVALFLQHRISFGIISAVRYPDDEYDRIWNPPNLLVDYTLVKREDDSIVVNSSDQPPKAVLLGVILHLTKFGFGRLPTVQVPIYMNMYFAAVDKEIEAYPPQKRSFLVFKDDLLLTSEPVVPYYNNVTELSFPNITASSASWFYLVPASNDNSTVTPTINALELFLVSDPLTRTSSTDVEGLDALQGGFSILREWKSDPCLPKKDAWDWLNCSADVSPRVIALNLSGYGLSGPLPDFSSMDALEYIDLQNNNLTGNVPEFLGLLPNLKELNLSGNNFNGSIPRSLLNKNISFSWTGNKNLRITSHGGKHRNTLQTISGALISIFILSLVLI